MTRDTRNIWLTVLFMILFGLVTLSALADEFKFQGHVNVVEAPTEEGEPVVTEKCPEIEEEPCVVEVTYE